MLGFGYVLLVMMIIATISIAETSRTHEGLLIGDEVYKAEEALDLISGDMDWI